MTENSMKPRILYGRIRYVPVENVDTDMIFHNRYLHITDPAEMGQYIFDNLPGYTEFPDLTEQGDILVVGHNFGCGSSRQQAVDGFISLGVAAIIGESFGAIYKRNAINAGWTLIESTGILKSGLKEGDNVSLNLETGEIENEDGSIKVIGKPFTKVQMDIYQAGGLLKMESAEG